MRVRSGSRNVWRIGRKRWREEKFGGFEESGALYTQTHGSAELFAYSSTNILIGKWSHCGTKER